MAITFDTAGAVSTTFSDSLTQAITIAANDNRMLVVGVSGETGNEVPLGITYNNVALTKYDEQYYSANNNACSFWYLAAPATGENNLVVTWNGNTYRNVGWIVLYNVAQAAPEAGSKATNTGTTASVAVTTVADGAWIVDVVGTTSSTNNMTCSASQTERWETTSNCRGNGSTCPVATGGTEQTVSWTLTSGVWAIIAASFAPAVSGGSASASPIESDQVTIFFM